MRKLVRSVILFVARTFGTHITDNETKESLGRVLIIPWRGKVHVIGLQRAVRIEFRPQERLTYWKQEIVFRVHPPPDFPNERKIDNR